MELICKQELLELLQNKYGDLTDGCGCSVYVDGEYEWLSVADIVKLINECCVYDDED